MTYIQRPSCPKCQNETMLARVTSASSGFDIRTFECPACNFVHQIAVALVDPMKSGEMSGWLRGELQAPN